MKMGRTLAMTATACLAATAGVAQAPTPPFVLATYYRCDDSRQTRADTLFKQVIAPLLDKQIKAGHLTNYAFSSHRIGGAWRRLESMTAPSLEHLMAARDAFQDELDKTNPKGSAEFDAICGSHDDYIWQRVLTSPPAPPAPTSFTYSRYLNCDQSKEGEADMIMGTEYAPMMNKHLAAGHITSWGYLTHNMGGPIRRILTWTAPTALSALSAEDMISGDMATSGLYAAFAGACSSHSDYLWATEVTSSTR